MPNLKRSDSFWGREKYTAELTQRQLIAAICICLVVCLIFFLLGNVTASIEISMRGEKDVNSAAAKPAPAPPQTARAPSKSKNAKESEPTPVQPAKQPRTVELPPAPAQKPEPAPSPTPQPVSETDVNPPAPSPAPSAPPPAENVSFVEPRTGQSGSAAPAAQHAPAKNQPTEKAEVPKEDVKQASTVTAKAEKKPASGEVTQSSSPSAENQPPKQGDKNTKSNKSGYTIQVGAFSQAKNAEDAKRLLQANTELHVEAVPSHSGKFTLVVVGDFKDRAEALAALDDLKKKPGFKDSLVIQK